MVERATKVKRAGRLSTPVGEVPIPNVDDLPMP
jgi:hypothetical protein